MAIIRYIDSSEYDYWDNFVDLSEQGSCFSKSWWLVVSTNNNFKICIYEGDGEIFAGLPLPYYESGKIRMPLLTQSTGILFSDKSDIKMQKKLTNQKEQTNLIIEFMLKDLISFNINFHYNYDYWLPFYWKKFRQTTLYTYIIDYRAFIPDEHFTTLSKGHKWILNKVQKKTGLKVVVLNDLNTFYMMSKKTYKRQNINISYSFELLEQFHQELLKNNACKMFQVIDEENNIHAVNYIIYDQHEAYYWLGASDSIYRNIGGHTFLIWHTIKYFSDKTLRFNFGGSMMEDVEKNFRNFGGILKPYFNISINDQFLLKEIKRRMPVSLKNKLKNFLSILKVK